METVFLVCAVGGSVIVLCQLVMTLLGLGGHDFGADHDGGVGHGGDVHAAGGEAHGTDAGHHGSSWFFGVIGFRALVAAVAFFGLAGLGAVESNFSPYAAFVVASAAGAAAMFLVAWMMRLLSTLYAEGTVRIERSVGEVGSVYLTIPAERKGAGKILVKVQNRTMEYQAMTSGEKLPAGTRVVVTGVASSSTVDVEKADN